MAVLRRSLTAGRRTDGMDALIIMFSSMALRSSFEGPVRLADW